MAAYVEADDRVSLCEEGAAQSQHPFAALQSLLDEKSGNDHAQ